MINMLCKMICENQHQTMAASMRVNICVLEDWILENALAREASINNSINKGNVCFVKSILPEAGQAPMIHVVLSFGEGLECPNQTHTNDAINNISSS